MAEDFAKAVDDGLKLAKRIYYGKGGDVAPPRLPPLMERSAAQTYIPTAPMVYAVIPDPGVVDNPDLPSYQPHVHGRCDPPALIPLQMNAIELEVDCYLDTALVRVTGTWRVHCVKGSRSCDCRIAIPMGEQGSILGVEVEIPRKSYSTQLITAGESEEVEKAAQPENGGFLKPHIFTLTIPQVDGGTKLSIKMCWSQKSLYTDQKFSIVVPFHFPEYVTPVVKKISKREKIHLSIHAGTGTEVLCNTSGHPLKEKMRQAGKLHFSYEADVLKWSNTDFNCSYVVSSSHIFGGLLLQSPSVHDSDQREMFYVYLIPGSRAKAFKQEVIFVIDISGSMNGKPLEDTKNAIASALSKLNARDSFNIIAFSDDTSLFSMSMELATSEAVERAIQWMGEIFVAAGGTNMLPPLEKAVEMLSNTHNSIPMIFFITDGATQEERHVCNVIKKHLASSGSLCPRIHTFGIGTFCNHYFLQMLANLSRGQYEYASDTECIEERMEKLFTKALSTILVNITLDSLQNLDEVQVYPSINSDLSSSSPLIISGRYRGRFPENVKAKGLIGDLSSFAVDLTIQTANDMPLHKVFAKDVINILTAEAWLSGDKQLQQKIAKISIQTGVPSEYTQMILLENTEAPKRNETAGSKKKVANNNNNIEIQKMVSRTIPLQILGIGFGDITATAENVTPGFNKQKEADAAEKLVKAASNCCSSMCNKCCCLRCIQCCSKLNDQCTIVCSQLLSAFAYIACFECCSEICCSGGDDGQ